MQVRTTLREGGRRERYTLAIAFFFTVSVLPGASTFSLLSKVGNLVDLRRSIQIKFLPAIPSFDDNQNVGPLRLDPQLCLRPYDLDLFQDDQTPICDLRETEEIGHECRIHKV